MALVIDALLYGYRVLFEDTTEKPTRSRLSFGRGFTISDDSVNEWSRVEVEAPGATGDDAGVHTNDADVLVWTPSSTSPVRTLTVAGALSTSLATAVDVPLILGAPAVEIDADDFVVQASAVITARKGSADWATFRVSRSFARDGGGAVAAGAATSDDGKDLQGTASSTPWGVPVLTWDTTTKFPKVTVTSAEATAILWRVAMSVVVGADA